MKVLSKIDRKKIQEAFVDGLTRKELASLFDVHPNTISRIIDMRSEDSIVDKRADLMEAMLGGATRDDGCYSSSVPKNSLVPDCQIDNNDPLSVLLAEEEVLLHGD